MESKPVPELMRGINRVVGETTLVLHNFYDDDQLWFPFMTGTYFCAQEPEAKPPHKIGVGKIQPTYARLSDACRQPYVYMEGVPQFVLPFNEWKRIRKSQQKQLSMAKWPEWERTSDGSMLSVLFAARQHKQDTVEEWCDSSCWGRYMVHRTHAVFAESRDYALAKVFFG